MLQFDQLKDAIILAADGEPNPHRSIALIELQDTLSEFWANLRELTAWELYMAFSALAWFNGSIGSPKLIARRKLCKRLATCIYQAYDLANVRETSRENWQPLKFVEVWLQIANAINPHTQDSHYELIRATAVREAQDFLTMEMTRKCPPQFEGYRPDQSWQKIAENPVPRGSEPFEVWHKDHGLQLVSACDWHLDPQVEEKVIYFHVIGERHKAIMNDTWCQGFTHWRPVRPGPANV